jgi:hypothetical protein
MVFRILRRVYSDIENIMKVQFLEILKELFPSQYMLVLNNSNVFVVTSNLKIQSFGNLEYAYFLKYLTYITIFQTKKACNKPGKRNLYLRKRFF